MVLLAGCTALESIKTKNYSPSTWVQLSKASLDSFTGKEISEAQKAFGYNFTDRNLGDGRTAYTWGGAQQIGNRWGGTGSTNCNWTFIANPQKIIIANHKVGHCPRAIKTN